jgi:hypothetical protein
MAKTGTSRITYRSAEYDFVNQREVDGVTYTAFRCIDDPKRCIIVRDDGKVKTSTNLRVDWINPGALWQ